MGALAKGDIVLFPFPYSDLSQRKLRPCLVISDEMGEDILICQITSQQARKDAFVVLLRKDETLGGTLALDSFIRTNMLFTAEIKQVQRKICSLRPEQYRAVAERIVAMVSQ